MKLINCKIKAFTLIELLVVIAIVGILSGLIVVSMSSSTNLANDAKRRANIDTIRTGLVIYGTLNRMIYPIQTTPCTIGGGTTPCSTLASNLSGLLSNLPVDPIAGNYYTYVSDSTGANYVLSANLSSSTLSYNNKTGYVDGVVDVDGNHYGAITIGTQTWITTNLMTTKYRDGTAITRGPTGATWDGADHGYYAYPPNIANNAEESLANIVANNLGFVYQQSAVTNVKGICPTGWHVPSDADFKTLVEYLGTANCDGTGGNTGWFCPPAGLRLKEAGTVHWVVGNNTNTSGFSAVGAGNRITDGSFCDRYEYATFWSSSPSLVRHLYCTEPEVVRSTALAAYGFSVRCLKD